MSRIIKLSDLIQPYFYKFFNSKKITSSSKVAGIAGHTIDSAQFEYWSPEAEVMQQDYYRFQTTLRSGWQDSVKDTHGYTGIYGEPMDRLQLNIDNYDAYQYR